MHQGPAFVAPGAGPGGGEGAGADRPEGGDSVAGEPAVWMPVPSEVPDRSGAGGLLGGRTAAGAARGAGPGRGMPFRGAVLGDNIRGRAPLGRGATLAVLLSSSLDPSPPRSPLA